MINNSLFLIIQNYLKFLINTKNMMPNFTPLPEHALYDPIRFFLFIGILLLLQPSPLRTGRTLYFTGLEFPSGTEIIAHR